MDELVKAYYSPKTGYISAYKLAKKIPGIKQEDVEEFVNNQYTDQVNKQIKSPTVYNTINSVDYGENYQMDIINYDRFERNHYKYILVVIDVYSRFVDARAMTNRENSTILDKIKEIFKDMGIPRSMNMDNEFNTKSLNKYFEDNNIKTFFSQPHEINKNAIVERFNRTLAGMLQKWREGSGELDWYKVLSDIIENYNTTYHRTIKATPLEVKKYKKESEAPIINIDNPYKVGEKVRKIKHRTVFDKGDKRAFTKTVYDIVKIDGNKIYLDESDIFYKPYELLKINKVETKPITKEKNDELTIIRKENKVDNSKKKQEKVLKKVGIEQSNLVEGKRKKKVVNRLDL